MGKAQGGVKCPMKENSGAWNGGNPEADIIMFPWSVGFKESTGRARSRGFRYFRISHIASLMMPTRKVKWDGCHVRTG